MLGFIESPKDPRDYTLKVKVKSQDLPEEYDCSTYYNIDVLNQYTTSKCVPFSLSTAFKTLSYNNFKLNIDNVYNRRPNAPKEGMTIRDALKIIKKDLKDPFFQYFRLNSILQMKYSIVSNGAFILALPVKNMHTTEFWKGTGNEGGHSICCVGYNKQGFILQNSWGYEWANGGKCILPYSDVRFVIEAWGLV